MDRAFEESKDEEESANDYEEEPVADTEEEEEALGPSEAAESWHVQPRSKHAARPGSAPSQANVAGLRRRLQSSEDRLRRLEQAGGAQVQNQRNFMALASLTTLIGRQQWQSPWMPPMPMGFPMLMQPPPAPTPASPTLPALAPLTPCQPSYPPPHVGKQLNKTYTYRLPADYATEPMGVTTSTVFGTTLQPCVASPASQAALAMIYGIRRAVPSDRSHEPNVQHFCCEFVFTPHAFHGFGYAFVNLLGRGGGGGRGGRDDSWCSRQQSEGNTMHT